MISTPHRGRADFTLLCLGQLVSQFGDSIFHIGLLWLALDLTGSRSGTGLIAASAYLPVILLSLAAGVVVDRLDRRRLMMACAGLQGLVVACVPALHAAGWLSGPALAAVAFGLAAGAAFFNPARDALVPQLVGPEGLTRANSFVQVTAQLAYMAGPAAAGLLVAWVGLVHLFTIDAATFVFSLLTLWLIRSRPARLGAIEPGPAIPPQVPPVASSMADVAAGLRLAWKDSRLRGLLFITAVDNLIIMGPAIVGMPIYVRDVLGGGAEAYAALTAVLFAGMVSTSLLIGFRGAAWPKGKLIAVGMLLDGASFTPLALIDSFSWAAVALFVHGLTVPLLVVPRTTLVQQIVPDASRGRIFALLNISVVGFTALSTALTGLVAEFVDMGTLYLAIGIAGAACGLVSFGFRSLLGVR
ncbi:MAG: MFS transporter [Deltaproteobacteria bacterium]|nr:MFS transporter [Deltaproteobacteria bacterium]